MSLFLFGCICPGLDVTPSVRDVIAQLANSHGLHPLFASAIPQRVIVEMLDSISPTRAGVDFLLVGQDTGDTSESVILDDADSGSDRLDAGKVDRVVTWLEAVAAARRESDVATLALVDGSTPNWRHETIRLSELRARLVSLNIGTERPCAWLVQA